MDEEEIVWQGRFITAKRRGTWEYVSRARNIHAAVILAIDHADHVLLVEQYRTPLGRRCIELPAGLIGDSDELAGEDARTTAARELEEETGYRAGRIELVGEFWSSPGMVSESFTLRCGWRRYHRPSRGAGADCRLPGGTPRAGRCRRCKAVAAAGFKHPGGQFAGVTALPALVAASLP